MPGPIDGLRFAHTAIERELTDLESLVSKASSPADVAALAERFAFLEKFCDGHTKGEELGLFPELDKKLPKVSATYLFDHGDERAAFARIHRDLERCASGEVEAVATLRGEVTSIGGLKEKLLAARRGGIKTVLITQDNVKDLQDIPENVKNQLEIGPVKWIDQVLEHALDAVPQALPDEEPAKAAEPAAAAAVPPVGDVLTH